MSPHTRRNVVALDLEGTLISNAMSQIPRPGLHSFLDECRALSPHVVLFTYVRPLRVREIIAGLVADSLAPEWFIAVECVEWDGATKDLRFIRDCHVESAVLVDDLAAYVHPGQELNWVPAPPFEAPYPEDDRGLEAVLRELRRRFDGHGSRL